MKAASITTILLLFLLAQSSCAPTPTQMVLVDAFFGGQALLDSNGNGKIDDTDMPLENATLIVTLQSGAEFGGLSDNTGRAFITIPGGVEYPVTMRAEAPKDSALKLIGPSSFIIAPGTVEPEPAIFLFSK